MLLLHNPFLHLLVHVGISQCNIPDLVIPHWNHCQTSIRLFYIHLYQCMRLSRSFSSSSIFIVSIAILLNIFLFSFVAPPSAHLPLTSFIFLFVVVTPQILFQPPLVGSAYPSSPNRKSEVCFRVMGCQTHLKHEPLFLTHLPDSVHSTHFSFSAHRYSYLNWVCLFASQLISPFQNDACYAHFGYDENNPLPLHFDPSAFEV